jgi:hypothetical protein
MNDHKIDQTIYALVALSAALAVILTVSLLVQLHAEGSELLSWNSWVDYFSQLVRVI